MKRGLFRANILFCLLALVLTLCVAQNIKAQDFNLTQYNSTPFQINPGIVAVKKELQLITIGRMNTLGDGQHANTLVFTGIHPLINKQNKHYGGIGINVFSDRVGDPATYQFNGISLALGYNLILNSFNKISFGIQPGIFQRKITTQDFTTGNQWVTNIGFDQTVATGEHFDDNSVSFINLSSGFYWTNVDKDKVQRAHLGIAGYNLNQSSSGFLKDNHLESSIKYIVTGGMRVMKRKNVSISSELLFINLYNTNYYNIGPVSSFSFKTNPFSIIKSGTIISSIKYASNSSLLNSIQLVQPLYSIGFSFDYGFGNASKFQSSTSGFEFMVSIRKPLSRKKHEHKIVENYSVGEVREFYQNEAKILEQEKTLAKSRSKNSQDIEEEASPEDLSTPVKFALKREFKFKFNDSEIIDAGDVSFIEDLIKLLNSNKKLRMEIVGHADNVGTSEINLKISEQRAQVVLEQLVKRGIDRKRLVAIGKGDKEPLVKNDSETNRAMNRRVEFLIYER